MSTNEILHESMIYAGRADERALTRRVRIASAAMVALTAAFLVAVAIPTVVVPSTAVVKAEALAAPTQIAEQPVTWQFAGRVDEDAAVAVR